MGSVGESMELDAVVPSTATSKKTAEIDVAVVEKGIAEARALAEQGKKDEAVDKLLGLEQKCRLAEDVATTRDCCTAILEILYADRDWTALQDTLLLLCKRRGQLRQAILSMIRQVSGYADDTPDLPTKIALIKLLQDLTEGKMFVEIERARLTRRLAALTEASGKVAEAAEILQEVAVETFGAMAKTEKIAFILEQVRLCLDKGDYSRAQILAKKVSSRAFASKGGAKRGEGTGEIGIEGTAIEPPAPGTPSLEELKKTYYALMIRYYSHTGDYLEICRSYRAIFEEGDLETLRKICWFVVLAPRDSHQATLLANTAAEPDLDSVPGCKDLLKRFQTKEIIWWQLFSADLLPEMEQVPDLFGPAAGDKHRDELKLRVVEHNLSVIASYYSQISMQRLTQLLDLSSDEASTWRLFAETRLSEMVVAKKLVARIDRPAGTITFALGGAGSATGTTDAELSTWSANIARLLDTVESTCQKIQKESMIHKIPIGSF